MILEITGGGFANKGDQLMLATVCQRLRSGTGNVDLCVPLKYNADEDDALNRAHYRLLLALDRPRHWRAPRRYVRDLLGNLVGKTELRRALGLCPESEIDGLIDISGYAYGDYWSPKKADNLRTRAAALRERKKPVILLPQMLGPFTEESRATAFRELAKVADLIYARDRTSLDCARPLVEPEKLRLAPDITIATPPRPVPVVGPRYACIVPNSKVLRRNPQGQDWRETYLSRLVQIHRHLVAQGLDVKIVQHEYKDGDTKLVESLVGRIGEDVQSLVVRDFDPQVLKSVLGSAELVVGSRFHSLVSTLSMGVPAIALGWAHKYDALFDDFGVPELVHRAADPEQHLLDLIDRILDLRGEYVTTLKNRGRSLTKHVEAMWTEVFMTLGICST